MHTSALPNMARVWIWSPLPPRKSVKLFTSMALPLESNPTWVLKCSRHYHLINSNAMFCLNDSNRFFFYLYPIDMRKSFYSLSGMVSKEMGMNVQNRDSYTFLNKKRTNLKVLHAEFGGLVIYNMKLEKGTLHIFHW